MGLIEQPALLQRHRLTVDEYHRMADAGVLAPDARVELIEGEVVDMAPMRSRHASVVGRLNALLSAVAAGHALVWCQLPLRLGTTSEPEPDLMLLKPRDDFYAAAHPGAADVLLLVEVSDSTARYDREVKVPLYARHGVPEVWVVDLDDRVLRVYRSPAAGEYTEIRTHAEPGVLTPLAAPELALDLTPLFVVA
jgi:Uma2 family endonuclease